MAYESQKHIRVPRALFPGDGIQLVAPAGPFVPYELEQGADVVRSMGFEPVWDEGVFQKQGFFAGSDRHRARMFVQALKSPRTKAVWSIRGGYGTARMLAMVSGTLFETCHKILVGFSDVSSLLLRASMVHGLVSIHGPVVTQLPRIPKTNVAWLKKLMTDPRALGTVPLGRLKTLRDGVATGILAGGNLSVLASLVGTGMLPDFRGCILFVEDVAEPAYSIDRMWQQLLRSGALDGLMAVVVGELTGCIPAGRSKWSARSVLERAVYDLGVPAVSGASFGHGRVNIALPVGVPARLDAHEQRLELLRKAVR